MKKRSPYRYADTQAAMMFRNALSVLQREKKVSLRALAKVLEYKQATVLSHMANGRIPVPIKKAPEIATALGLPQSEFLLAVMDQRQTETRTSLMSSAHEAFGVPETFADELEDLAGVSLDNLTPEQKNVMRKVALDANPERRWLSESEIAAVQLLRRLRPRLEETGLDRRDRILITQALESGGG